MSTIFLVVSHDEECRHVYGAFSTRQNAMKFIEVSDSIETNKFNTILRVDEVTLDEPHPEPITLYQCWLDLSTRQFLESFGHEYLINGKWVTVPEPAEFKAYRPEIVESIHGYDWDGIRLKEVYVMTLDDKQIIHSTSSISLHEAEINAAAKLEELLAQTV